MCGREVEGGELGPRIRGTQLVAEEGGHIGFPVAPIQTTFFLQTLSEER